MLSESDLINQIPTTLASTLMLKLKSKRSFTVEVIVDTLSHTFSRRCFEIGVDFVIGVTNVESYKSINQSQCNRDGIVSVKGKKVIG